MLECTGINKRFGGLQAIRNLDFKIERDKITGLIGPNGAGKTTIFNLVTGYLKPDSGHVTFNGQDITKWSPHEIVRAGIARTFQISRPFASMTVLETVAIASVYGRRKTRDVGMAKEEALRILEFTKLVEKKARKASELTTVDLRRLEISRALATNPDLIMLDEVMAGLNDNELAEVIGIVGSIKTKLGKTIFLVEHVMKAIMSLSNHVIVLQNGEKIAEGNPDAISKNVAVIDAYLGV